MSARTGFLRKLATPTARRRVGLSLVLTFLMAAPATPDDRQLLQAAAGPDVLIILDSSLSMNHDFTDAFDLPAYMDDFLYPQGTSTGTSGSKIGAAKSVLREVLSTTAGVNFAFAYYRNPNPTFGAAQVTFNSRAIGGAQQANQLLENGGVEWLYFADELEHGGAISTEFDPNEYPDIQQGRFLQLGHKVMHNYNRENTGELADIRYPYVAPGGPAPGTGGKPALPVPGFWRGAFGPNPKNVGTSGMVVYRNPNKPGYELRMFLEDGH